MPQLNVPLEAIEKLFAYAKADYDKGGYTHRESKLGYEVGKKFIKLMHMEEGRGRSVFGFIVNTDDASFPKGAILKAAGWKAPAMNFARGSIYNEDTFKDVRWTGIG